MKFKALLFAIILLLSAGHAQAQEFETLAKQAIVIDVSTGAVLLDKNAGDRMPTASMSKVMTMYMVFEALKQGRVSLTDEFTISEKAWRMEGSKMFIRVDTQVKVEDLVRGVIIQSGNDAAVALAEGIGGSEEAFVDAMNQRAKEIGLTGSHFMNATGWPDPDHYSTPRDLAILAHRIMIDFPEYYHYFAEKEFVYNKIKQPNRDPLLGRVSGADGLKTGHTEEAGYGLIGSAMRNGRRLIMVLNGMSSEKERADEGARVLEWGFRDFESLKIVSAGQFIDEAPVWLGEQELVPLIAENDVTVVIPRNKRNQIGFSASYLSPLSSPIKKGEQLGKLKITVPGQQPVEVNLQAGADVERKGMFGRARARLEYLLSGNI